MKKYLTLIISIIALLIAFWAGWTAKQAHLAALSAINVLESNMLETPVYDEAENRMGFLAIYDIAITNTGAVDIILESIEKITEGSGFLVFLTKGKVALATIEHREFMVAPTIDEIQQNPKLIKSILENNMDMKTRLHIKIEKGKTRFIRLGLYFFPYDPAGTRLADSALVSFQLHFNHGKSELFRRAIQFLPVPPVDAIPGQ